jgi:hypothetical protein
MQSLILDRSRIALATIVHLYDLTEPRSCATFIHDRQEYLNSDCAIVRRHVCLAYQGLAQADLEAKDMTGFERTRNAALHDHCTLN